MFAIKDSLVNNCKSTSLVQNINTTVERVRDITFDASLLANRHILRLMTTQNTDVKNYFHQSHWFFLACMKLVCGSSANVPPNCSEEYTLLQETWSGYPVRFTRNGDDLWHILSYSAGDLHTAWVNHVSLHFEEKLGYYIFFRLWEQHPLTNVPEGTTEDNHEYEEEGEDIEGEEEETKDNTDTKRVQWQKMSNANVWKLTDHILNTLTGKDTKVPRYVKDMATDDRLKVQVLVGNVLKYVPDIMSQYRPRD